MYTNARDSKSHRIRRMTQLTTFKEHENNIANNLKNIVEFSINLE